MDNAIRSAVNAGTETIPAFAVVEPDGSADAGGRVGVRKCTRANGSAVFFNGPLAVLAGGFFGALPPSPTAVAGLDPLDLPLAANAQVGTKPGQWFLKPGQTGFRAVAPPTLGAVLVAFEPAGRVEARVRNDTGYDQPIGAILAYTLQIKPSTSTVAEFVVSFNAAPLVYGYVPVDRDDNFCVLLAPLPAGQIGPAVVAGLVGGPDSASTSGGPYDPFGAAYGQYLQCVPGSTSNLRRAVRGKARFSGGGFLLDFVTGGAPVVIRLTAYRLFNGYDFVEVEPEGNVAGQQYAAVPGGITGTYPGSYATNIAFFFGSEASGPFDMPVGSVVVAWRDQRVLGGVTQRWLFGPYYRVVAQTGTPNLYRWCIGTPIDAVTFTTTTSTSTTSTTPPPTTTSTTTTSTTTTTTTTPPPTTTTTSTTTPEPPLWACSPVTGACYDNRVSNGGTGSGYNILTDCQAACTTTTTTTPAPTTTPVPTTTTTTTTAAPTTTAGPTTTAMPTTPVGG